MSQYTFDPFLDDEERHFYKKAYPTLDVVRDRRVHCTVCKCHIGTAPIQENSIKMHPILRVTHCLKCHDFYNSGEFSKGEDGSELYCRWCGQGGEVYCCSNCPYVFCKSCIVKNLSRGVVADIEQNENWSCFRCAPKILWPLRAQHWALISYIKQQKQELMLLNLPELELKQQMNIDRSKCCRFSKIRGGNVSDSVESIDSTISKRSNNSKRKITTTTPPIPHALNKRTRNNDELVCTPDLMSMLEPDCQITVSQKSNPRSLATSIHTTPKNYVTRASLNMSSLNNVTTSQTKSLPPPLVLRNTSVKLKPPIHSSELARTAIGQRNLNTSTNPNIITSTNPNSNSNSNNKKVYYTISGYRVDLNSAAQQDTYRLPNGKLIQVKRQTVALPMPNTVNNATTITLNSRQQQANQTFVTHNNRSVHITSTPYQSSATAQAPGNYNNLNGFNRQMANGQIPPRNLGSSSTQSSAGQPCKPVMVKHIFPETAIGQARSQLQEQVFNAMDICTHLAHKVQILANSNAYKQARNYFEIKELYIHLSYLLTYANGRFKDLQGKCLDDMRQLGFVSDADCLENGQLAAGVDYVCYGQLEDVDLFNTGSNSFHNQVYEYRKSLHDSLKNGENNEDDDDDDDIRKSRSSANVRCLRKRLLDAGEMQNAEPIIDDESNTVNITNGAEDNHLEDFLDRRFPAHWMEGSGANGSPAVEENYENDETVDRDIDNDNEEEDRCSFAGSAINSTVAQGTEDSMRRTEESHSFDRKLIRLVAQYPSIWCTQHPDYGNFDVTRKQWLTIASHFKRGENIKLRWKNIRKRFVRIEKRIAQGKRFNGHFDKAMAFLANRDLPEDQWLPVDCGDSDGDTYDRHTLDAIEHSLTRQQDDDEDDDDGDDKILSNSRSPPLIQESLAIETKTRSISGGNKYKFYEPALRPIDIKDVDLRIINFVKANAILWQKSVKPDLEKEEEDLRESLWTQLHDCIPKYTAEVIKDRWQQLYEMYKVFRLKIIKSPEDHAMLEFKYSKYLAKLYFLYKIDEHFMRNEHTITFEDSIELENDEKGDNQSNAIKLQDMPDDKEFLHKLVNLIRQYPAIWDTQHVDYNNIEIRNNYWQEIHNELRNFGRDIRTIKLRWQLAKFSYLRWRSETGQNHTYKHHQQQQQQQQTSKIEYYAKNLPKDEMTFLN